MQTFYQLTIDGQPFGKPLTCVKQIAANAIDVGLATPDRAGRIVLHDAVDITSVSVKCAGGPCRSPGACAADGRCGMSGSCNNH